ncbi:MAG: hypothetical protein AAB963_00475 [Patescibacteria group bacterium]
MSVRSMERLIGLAQKTGGKFIVHNPLEDHDVVILDVDEYEKLVIGENDYEMFRPDVREMSEGELLDQINRDIAAWRANKDQEEKWEQEMMLDEDVPAHIPTWSGSDAVGEEEPLSSPFAEHNYHPADWHSVSDVINKKYASLKSEDELDFLDDDVGEEIKIEDIPNFGPSVNEVESEIEKVEKVEKKDDELISVPFRPMGVDIAWQEEPLASDEPVFYEEPV